MTQVAEQLTVGAGAEAPAPDGRIFYRDDPGGNARHYSHQGCGSWVVPLDDVPAPESRECADCAAYLPVTPTIVVKRHDYARGHGYEIIEPAIGKVESATTIVQAIINKVDFLGPWYAKQAVEGLHLLAKRYPDEDLLGQAPADLYDWLKREKLTARDRMDSAGDRGTAVHAALERYAEDGTLPDPARAHPVDRGYVAAAAAFLNDVAPTITGSEVVVGSAQHRFAGTFDAEMEVDPERVAAVTAKEGGAANCIGPKDVQLSGPFTLADYKTSKRAYADHHLQLALYEVARREMGKPPTDERLIVHLTPTGKFGLYVGVATPEMAGAAVAWYHQLQVLENLT